MARDEEQLIVRAILEDDLSGPATQVQESLDDMSESARDASDSHDQLADSQDRNRDAMDRHRRSTDRSTSSRRTHTRETDRNTESTRRNTRRNRENEKSLGGTIRKLMRASKLMQKFASVLGMVFGGFILDIIRQAVGLINALAAGAYAFVAALAPVSGILIPLPSLLASMLQSIVGMKVGFAGVFGAAAEYDPNNIKAFNEALRDMGPNARAAAKALAQVKQAWKPVKKDIQEAAWSGLVGPIKQLTSNYMPILRKGLSETATVLNRIAKNALAFLNTKETRQQVSRIMAMNNQMLGSLGKAFTPMLRALLDLLESVGPVAIRIVDEIAAGLIKMSVWISTNGDRIAAFADKAWQKLKQVWRILVDFGVALFNIGKIGAGLGNEMLGGLGDLMKRFREWTESAEGQKRITKFFDDARPILAALGRLIAALGAAWGTVSDNGNNVVSILDTITKHLPNFAELVSRAGNYIEGIVKFAGAIIDILSGLNLISPVAIILNAVAIPLQIIANILTSLPEPMQSFIGLLVMGALAWRSWNYGILMTIKALGPVAKALGWIKGLLFAVLAPLKTAFVTGGFKALGAAIAGMLGPIGWVILAIVAVGAALVALYKKNAAFRKWVDEQWKKIKDVWNNKIYPTLQKAWRILKDTWDKAYAIVVPALRRLRDEFLRIWNDHIYPVLSRLWKMAKSAFDKIRTALQPLIDKFQEFWKKHGDKIMWVLKIVAALLLGVVVAALLVVIGLMYIFAKTIEKVFDFFMWILDTVVPWVRDKFEWLWDNIIRPFWNTVQTIWKGLLRIWGFFRWVIGLVVALWRRGFGAIGDAVDRARQRIGDAAKIIRENWNRIMGPIRTAWDAAWRNVTGIVQRARGIIVGYITQLRANWNGFTGFIRTQWNAAWGRVVGIVNTARTRIMGVWNAITGPIIRVLDRIEGAWTRVWGNIRSALEPILSEIQRWIDNIRRGIDEVRNRIPRPLRFLMGLATGGPVAPGTTAMVGEVGPEAFVSSTGKIQGIGMHGPEVMKFPTSGFVVPNHVLGGQPDGSVPGNVMRRLEGALAGSQAHGYETGTAQARQGARSQDTYMQDADTMPSSVTVQVMGNVTSNVDLEQAVYEGIRKYHREKRRRK